MTVVLESRVSASMDGRGHRTCLKKAIFKICYALSEQATVQYRSVITVHGATVKGSHGAEDMARNSIESCFILGYLSRS